MRIKYLELFSVRCLHDYFADHICKALSLRPTAECSRLLERYECLFRPTADGGAVYYAEVAQRNSLQDYQEGRPFSFTLTSSDPFLDIYTDMEVSDAGISRAERYYYFDNLNRYVDEFRGKERPLLHPPGAALANGPIAAKPRSFRYTFDSPRRSATLKVIDAVRKQIVWETTTPSNALSGWSLELAALPAGRFSLEVDNAQALEFYLSDEPPVKHWGLVEIFPGGPALTGVVPEDCRVIDADGSPTPRHFAISMNSRPTIWRYHIIDKVSGQQSYDDFMVVGTRKNPAGKSSRESKSIPFTRTQQQTGDGERILLFESQQGIPLYRFPSDKHVFSFTPKAQGTNADSALKLPYAQARSTKLDAESGAQRMCSDIYVYL